MPSEHAIERLLREARDFGVTQSDYGAAPRPARDEAHLACGVSRDDAADEAATIGGGREINAEAAAQHHVHRVGGLACGEEHAAAGKGEPLHFRGNRAQDLGAESVK